GTSDAYPVNAWLALTNQCNLRCVHCAIRYDENRPTERIELSDAAFRAFVTQILPHLETLKLGGNNLGEQLTATGWRERIAPLIASGVKLTLQTNGLLLTDEVVEELVAAGAEFDISVEGADAASYAVIRGNHFDQMLASVARIVEARSRHPESGTRVLFSCVAFHDNARQLPELVRLAARTGADAVAVMHLVPVWEEQRYQSLVYHRSLANEAFAEARRVAEECGVELIAPRPFDVGAMSRKGTSGAAGAGDVRPLPSCGHPWTSVSVNEKGEVTPCCNSYMVMGDLNAGSFDRIWNGTRYRRLRATVNTPGAPVNCRTCVLRDYEGTDEPLLLAAIGPNPGFAASMMFMRRAQRALRGSRLGARVLPAAKNAFRRWSR
ncbi:MAG TPA: radical SAM protein, partial [Coriobacteriia bacterium]